MKFQEIPAKAKRFFIYLWNLILRLLRWKKVVEKEEEIDIGYTKKVAVVTIPLGIIAVIAFLLLSGGAVHLALRQHYQVANGFITSLGLEKSGTRVVMAIDGSDSMSWLYANGTVQETANRVLALGLAFNGKKVPTYFFSTNARKAGNLTQKNFLSFMEKNPPDFEGTRYAEVLKMIGEKGNSKKPLLILFITDGQNEDEGETTEALFSLVGENVFIQFIGLDFQFASGSYNFPNVGFMNAGNIGALTDSDLYREALTPYAQWYHSH